MRAHHGHGRRERGGSEVPKFEVTITASVARTLVIEAESDQHAEAMVRGLTEAGLIDNDVLTGLYREDPDDIDVEITATRQAPPKQAARA
jgi:hypothetical protein